ncbi:YncE family protein [Polaromonas jejuensis]|uniref:YncE family protein n=1 Tax=Polaromonas jejuensis TaxID=457502 RepID=A0ABW0Q7F3_9BURK|nr:YncE family protein [Polaromonas jejuensis]
MNSLITSVLTAAALAAATLGPGNAAAQSTAAASSRPAATSSALRLVSRTVLPGYTGDFDHLAADVAGNRLFVAGEDGGTLEVFDLTTGKHLKTIKGFEVPHGVLYWPETNRLIVSDSGDGMSKMLDATTYEFVGTLKLTPGADVMSYDPSTRRAWIVTGGKNAKSKLPDTTVSEIDPATGKHLGDLKFDTDFTEGIAFEQRGHRAFVNVAGKHYVAVVDKRTRTVIDKWPVKEGLNNAPMALDEDHQRLFIVTRKPFKLVVLNTQTGASVASFDVPNRTNELAFDKVNKRIYAAGDDYIGVFRQNSADQYEELERIPSAYGGKTGLLVPQINSLFIAVSPGDKKIPAELLKFEVVPAAR